MNWLFSGIKPVRYFEERRGTQTHRFGIFVKAGLSMPGITSMQPPHVTVTADVIRVRKSDNEPMENGWESGGQQHELVRRYFPQLSDLCAFHLCSWDGEVAEPMHYIANARYWWVGREPAKHGFFQRTIIYGQAGEWDENVDPFAELTEAPTNWPDRMQVWADEVQTQGVKLFPHWSEDALTLWLQARQPALSKRLGEVLDQHGISIHEKWEWGERTFKD